MKRNPEKILNSLTQHSSDLEYKFERLYRILFNDEMYYIAYQHIYAKQGNMTKGVDGKTVDGFSVSHIEQLIDTLKNETYQPKPSQRVYIPKKNGKTAGYSLIDGQTSSGGCQNDFRSYLRGQF